MNDSHHNRFIIDSIDSAPPQEFSISGEEFQHLRVKRLKKGDIVIGLDGEGSELTGELTEIAKRKAVFRIIQAEKHFEPEIKISFGLSILKPGPMSFAVEKAVELGVWDIIPLEAARCRRKITSAEIQRLQRIAASAMKQSGGFFLPQVHHYEEFCEILMKRYESHQIIYADPAGESILRIAIQFNRVLLLIGPEGGFTKEEIKLIQDYKGTPGSLGKSRLRSETAAIAALAALQLKI